MGKSENERKSIDVALRDSPYFKGYRVVDDGERPDFIVRNGHNRVIGLEHCAIDMVLDKKSVIGKQKPPVASSRRLYSRICELHDKYHDKDVFCCNSVQDEVRAIIAEYMSNFMNFDVTLFEDEWFRIIFSHAKKSKSYRERVMRYCDENMCYRKHKQHDIRLGLVCEVTLPIVNNVWTVQPTYDSDWYNVCAHGLPMTSYMLGCFVAVMLLQSFDLVTIVTRSLSFDNAYSETYSLLDIFGAPCYFGVVPYVPWGARKSLIRRK